MSKGIQKTADCYSSAEQAEAFTLREYPDFPSDIITADEKPPHISAEIHDYRRIQNWENYFLCSAICSVGKSLGADIDDYHFYGNFTGDNFTYLYSAEKGNPHGTQCDSGVTNYFFMPQLVKKAFAAFGYDCIYLSNAQIKKDFRTAMNAIKASVDKKIPVIAWGMGNVGMKSGNVCNPLPEACLIGGYGENDVLYVNLYPGRERLPDGSVDEYGYSVITDGLNKTKGLFFAGEKLENTDMRQIYQEAVDSVPAFLTKQTADGDGGRYAFGKTAFNIWADTLETDLYFEDKTDDELSEICWNLHCSPYCCLCTSAALDFFKDAAERYPDMTAAVKVLPLYERLQNYRQEIWDYQGGFFPSPEQFRAHTFRTHVAGILRDMGNVCDEILTAYSS